MSDTDNLDDSEKLGFLWKSYLGFPNTLETLPFYQETSVPFNNYILGKDILLSNIPKQDDLVLGSDIKDNLNIDSIKVNHAECKIQNNIEINNVKANIIRKYTKIKLEPVPGTVSEGFSKGWYCLDNSGNNILSNAIQFNINQTQSAQPYVYTLYSSDGNSANSTLTSRVTNENHGNWIFDVKNGVINFPDKPTNFTLDSTKPLYLTFYKYIGDKGITNLDLKWDKNSDNENNIYYNRGKVGIGKTNPDIILDISSSDAIQLPTGTDIERPNNPKKGMIRYNTSNNTFEGYSNSDWGSLGSGSGGGGGSGGSAFTKDSNNNLYYTDGNVGIGKTDPRILLDVSGDKIGRCTTSDGGFGVHGTKHRNSFKIGRFDGDSAENFCGLELNVDTASNLGITGNDNQSSIIFKTWGYGNGEDKERMRIRSDGNVGIGTTSPEYKLDVNGDARIFKSLDLNLRSNIPFKFVQSISCGEKHSAILLNSGKVVTFGKNDSGQLGVAGLSESSVPVAVQTTNQYGTQKAISVSCGWYHTAILLDNGEVLTFGQNGNGQLGNTVSGFTNMPSVVQAGSGYLGNNAVSISCGQYHTAILLNTGKVVTFGSSGNGQLGNNNYGGSHTINTTPQAVVISDKSDYDQTNAIAISCGAQHTAILLNTGKVVTFGNNAYGQLGASAGYGLEEFPYNVNTGAGYDGTNAISVSCGHNHTAILLNTGKVVTFGYNDYGQLGNGNFTSTNTNPVVLQTVTSTTEYNGTNAIAVSCGGNHTAVLLEGGKVVTCGDDKNAGILGTGAWINNDPRNTLQEVISSGSVGSYDKTNAVTVSCGNEHTLVLLDNGVVNSFGKNLGIGQLGVGNDDYNYRTPTNVVADAGYNNNAALLELNFNYLNVGPGDIGFNYSFKFNVNNIQFPRLDSFVESVYEKNYSNGYGIGFERIENPVTINSYNSVGIGTTNPRKTLEIFGGDLMLYSGENDGGENKLFFNHSDTSNQYQKVAIISEALGTSQYGRAHLHFCVNTDDDDDNKTANVSTSDSRLTIRGDTGNVGIGMTSPEYKLDVYGDAKMTNKIINLNRRLYTPFKLVSTIACGREFTAILLNSGKVLTFGRNDYGQLGINSRNTSYNPNVRIVVEGSGYDQTNAISVSCGYYHMAILLKTGKVVTFGSNSYRQLGRYNNYSYYYPTYVENRDGYNSTNAISVFCGYYNTAILLNTGKVVTFGKNWYGEAGVNTSGTGSYAQGPHAVNIGGGYDGTNAISVSSSENHGAILLNTGKVITFGRNYFGQLGFSDNFGTTNANSTPKAVENNAGYDGTNAISVSCSLSHTTILLSNGKVVTCGSNSYGILGIGTTANDSKYQLQTVQNGGGYNGTNAKYISGGRDHTLILLDNGKIVGFGKDNKGQIGNGDATDGAGYTIPQAVLTSDSQGSYSQNNGVYNAVFISSGIFHNIILLDDGTVNTFGSNHYGDLGSGDIIQYNKPVNVITGNGYNNNVALLEMEITNIGVGNRIEDLKYSFKNSDINFPILNNFIVTAIETNNSNSYDIFNYNLENTIIGGNNIFFNINNDSANYQKVGIINEIIPSTQYGRSNLHFCVNTDENNVNVTRTDSILTINGDTGNVGIGTTDPQALLHIAHSESKINEEVVSLRAEGTIRTYGTDADVHIRSELTAHHQGGKLQLYDGWDPDEVIRVKLSAKLNEKNYINNGGNVGIGTTDPGYTLHVHGDINFTGNLLQGGNTFSSGGGGGGGSLWSISSNSSSGSNIVYNDGYVGIGTDNIPTHGTNNKGYPLYVHDGNATITVNDDIMSGQYDTNGDRLYRMGAHYRRTADGWGIYVVHSRYPNNTDPLGTNNNGGIRSAIGIRAQSSIMTTYLWFSSDQRIKKDIVEISDSTSLHQLRNIKVTTYKYKDEVGRGTGITYGFIAQQVAEHFPDAVNLKVDTVPNEMRLIENPQWSQIVDGSQNKFKLTIPDLEDVSGGTLYRFYMSNDVSGNDECLKETRTLDDDPKSFIFDQSWNNVFLYGKEVYDFHILDKNKLYTINFSATQEIDRIQQKQLLDISENALNTQLNKTEIDLLKYENQELKTEVNTLKLQNQTLQERLDAIEKRLNDANI